VSRNLAVASPILLTGWALPTFHTPIKPPLLADLGLSEGLIPPLLGRAATGPRTLQSASLATTGARGTAGAGRQSRKPEAPRSGSRIVTPQPLRTVMAVIYGDSPRSRRRAGSTRDPAGCDVTCDGPARSGGSSTCRHDRPSAAAIRIDAHVVGPGCARRRPPHPGRPLPQGIALGGRPPGR